MSFTEWWKNSSAAASEAHYALRFGDAEIADFRRGILNDSAKAKTRARLRSVKKLTYAVLIGCGIPSALIFLAIAATLGFTFFRALLKNINPVSVCFSAFFVIVTGVILISSIWAFLKMLALKRATAEDLRSSSVGIAHGQVDAIIKSTKNSFTIHYEIGGIEYQVINDAIGSEIHQHFFGGYNLTGKQTYRTAEVYNFYHLPKSKFLLHFETA